MTEEPRERRYYLSRCKLGKNRVYWVVTEVGEAAPLAEGYCTTVEEAEQAVRAACPEARTTTSRSARYRHRLKVHERRKARPKGAGGAEVRRFVYSHGTSEFDGHEYWVAYPIRKVTPKRVFVGRASHVVGKEEFPARPYDPTEECASLDRDVFEREGEIYYHKWRMFFHRDLPGPSRPAPSAEIERALSVLGLEWPAAPDEVRTAYRSRVLVAHPDVGGSEEEFRRVHEAYELCAGA